MKRKFEPIDLNKVKTYPLSERKSKVGTSDFAKTWQKGSDFQSFLDGLPDILAGSQIKDVISAIATAYRNQKTIIFGMGAHVIKVGLNPIVIDLMQRGIITSVAMNGAGIIHDLEIAMAGQTSEDVAAALGDGSFGMVKETCAFLGDAIAKSSESGFGLGRAVGQAILDQQLPLADQSILASGARLGVPVTVHVAIGTDIIHFHPNVDGASIGEASHLDFRIFARLVSTLEEGVLINLGSAVILPEVFLKALTLVRNLGYQARDFTTVNMDFIRHYRPMTNVVHRPTLDGGKGYNLVGHHEIMFPLLAAAVIERLKEA